MSRSAVSLLFALFVAWAMPARADEVRVLAAGAVQSAVKDVVRAFEAQSGHKVTVAFDTVGALRDRVLAGEAPHLVLLSTAAFAALEEKGRLVAGSRRSLGRTGVGLMGYPAAFPGGAPDIANPEKLKAVLLAAKSIAHADPARGATAGGHFRKVVEDLGLAEVLKERITVVPFGGAIAGEVAKGVFEIGVSQATEIVPHKDVRFLGFLPDALQRWTEYGLAEVAPATDASRALVQLLTGPDGQRAFAASGFRP